MKKIAILLMLASPAMAFAAGNTITFRGQVAVDGLANPVVQLPTVAKDSLKDVGAVAGETSFNVQVTGCTASASSDVAIKTMFLANAATTGGNIPNMGTAKNVALQLVNGVGGTAVKLVGGVPTSVAGIVLKKGTDVSAEHAFAVRYVSEAGGADAGSVVGSVQYALDYL